MGIGMLLAALVVGASAPKSSRLRAGRYRYPRPTFSRVTAPLSYRCARTVITVV